MNEIGFFTEELKFILKAKRKVRKWIEACARLEGRKIIQINYIFCKDDYLLAINKKYLDHDALTDTITFEYSNEGREIIGDIFISIERVRENARKYSVSVEEETKRVMIHGFLHLCGYSDKRKEGKAEMAMMESQYLSLLNKSFT